MLTISRFKFLRIIWRIPCHDADTDSADHHVEFLVHRGGSFQELTIFRLKILRIIWRLPCHDADTDSADHNVEYLACLVLEPDSRSDSFEKQVFWTRKRVLVKR